MTNKVNEKVILSPADELLLSASISEQHLLLDLGCCYCVLAYAFTCLYMARLKDDALALASKKPHRPYR